MGNHQKTGSIQVMGERKKGDKMIKTYKRHFEVNKRKVDATKLRAFISDGVLTIAAPKKKRRIEKKRIIPVNNVIQEATSADPNSVVTVADKTSAPKDEDTKTPQQSDEKN